MTGLVERPVVLVDSPDTSDVERFAGLLAGADGPYLVRQAVARADCSDGLIGWTVRVYLFEGMRLGSHAASDVDRPAERGLAAAADDLADRFATSSPLQRSVVLLHWHEHQDEDEIADVLGCSTESVSTYLDTVRERLDVGPARAHTEQDLRRLLHRQARSGGPRTAPSPLFMVPPILLTTTIAAREPDAPEAEAFEPRTPVATDLAPADVLDDSAGTLRAVHVKAPPPYPSQRVVRPLIAVTAVLGLNYLVWRWIFSIHWSAWWIAVPLVLAETYSLVDSLLFGFTMWRLKKRPDPGPPPEGATVDVFITTYNEPLDLVMATARAAQQIRHPHTLWILDDGNRAELRELAGGAGIGVISRSADWVDMPRHAKAGNLNNALMVTQGEFIVILDADQVPMPDLLDRTLGYFRDERMAIVQTPQFFVNVPESDPLGSQAPLFYGPIQQGKDGWNAAFFCGSNAVLRREALLQMGIRRYVRELEVRISDALDAADKVIRRARASHSGGDRHLRRALTEVGVAAQQVRADLGDGVAIADATRRFQAQVQQVSRRLVKADFAMSQADLDELRQLTDGNPAGNAAPAATLSPDAIERLSRRDWSPLGAIETVRALLGAVDVDREDEAQPIMPMSTISVTEDMATCMRLHAMGWKSAYHDEVLAVGLAPEDVGTMLTQRLRWAQGTIQVLLRENPFLQKGLSFSQKVMYTATMWSYFSGFAALAYIAAPVIYLMFGVLPVHALSVSFFARLIPFLIFNQLLFFVIGRGRHTWRGQQYSLALFPVWIKAVTSAVGNVAFGKSLSFAVTRKTKLTMDRRPWHLVRPQLFAMALLVVAAGIGIARFATGHATELGTVINLVWVCFDLVLFSVIPRAVSYRGYEPDITSDGSSDAHDAALSPHLKALLETSR